MANEQNLMPIEEVNSRRTREEHREDSKKGGQKSGEVRRQRKAIKEQMDMLLSLPFNVVDKNGNQLKEMIKNLGIEDENIDNQMAMVVALWRTALGNGRNQITAIQEIRDIIGDKKEKENENIQRVQIINDLPEDDENGTSQN